MYISIYILCIIFCSFSFVHPELQADVEYGKPSVGSHANTGVLSNNDIDKEHLQKIERFVEFRKRLKQKDKERQAPYIDDNEETKPVGGNGGRPPTTVKPVVGNDGRPPTTVKPVGGNDGRPPTTVKPVVRNDGRPPTTVKPVVGNDGRPPTTVKPVVGNDERPPTTAKPEVNKKKHKGSAVKKKHRLSAVNKKKYRSSAVNRTTHRGLTRRRKAHWDSIENWKMHRGLSVNKHKPKYSTGTRKKHRGLTRSSKTYLDSLVNRKIHRGSAVNRNIQKGAVVSKNNHKDVSTSWKYKKGPAGINNLKRNKPIEMKKIEDIITIRDANSILRKIILKLRPTSLTNKKRKTNDIDNIPESKTHANDMTMLKRTWEKMEILNPMDKHHKTDEHPGVKSVVKVDKSGGRKLYKPTARVDDTSETLGGIKAAAHQSSGSPEGISVAPPRETSLLADKDLWTFVAVSSGVSCVISLLCCCFYKCLVLLRSKLSTKHEQSPMHLTLAKLKDNKNGNHYVVSTISREDLNWSSSEDEDELFNVSDNKHERESPSVSKPMIKIFFQKATE